jgi:hypothetical protein
MSEATVARANVAEMAPDPGLPQLPRLLDPDAMRPALGRSLGRDVASTRIAYVSYAPQARVVVQYEVTANGDTHDAVVLADAKADLAAWAVAPDHLALATKVGRRSPAEQPLAYDPEIDALIHWLPLDLALPALAEPPERLRGLMEEAGVETGPADASPRLIGYKPRRRAVFRLERHFVKAYGKESLFARSVRNLRAAASLPFPTARCEAVIPELRLEVQSLLQGRQADAPEDIAAEAGDLLAKLHASGLEGLRIAPPSYWIENAGGSARVVASVVPRLEPRLGKLLRLLEARMPDAALVPCHVDFFARQIMELDGEYGLVDFDRMSEAPPALDLATYVSELIEGPDLADAAGVLDALCDAYGSRPPGVPWYLTVVLLRRARTPFGHFLPDWPDEIERRVAAAEAALEL